MTPEVGAEYEVDNAWRLHTYADDEFFVAFDDGPMFVATHDGDGKHVKIVRTFVDHRRRQQGSSA